MIYSKFSMWKSEHFYFLDAAILKVGNMIAFPENEKTITNRKLYKSDHNFIL